MYNLILIRGLPGSGKSTLAESISFGKNHFEADHYFIDDDGNYNFKAFLLKEAHDACFSNADFAMKQCRADVIVANTFTQEWEMYRYIESAKIHGYRVHTLIVENRHGNTSVHGVPDSSMQKMRNRFEISL